MLGFISESPCGKKNLGMLNFWSLYCANTILFNLPTKFCYVCSFLILNFLERTIRKICSVVQLDIRLISLQFTAQCDPFKRTSN